jgi:enoyl-CoA hydratase/carnithine racemase
LEVEYKAYENILFEKDGLIAIVTLNRPKVHNAINTHVLKDLTDCFERMESDDEVRVIVLRGAGGKAFCAGADIDEIKDNGPVEQRPYQYLWMKWFRQIETIRKPVIASVEGWAPGGGTEISVCCDFVIAADDAKFGLAEIKIGVMPGAGATVRLTRWVGKAKAMEILMTGDFLSAEEAVRIGLATRVVPKAELWDETLKLAKALCERPPLALAAVKMAVNVGGDMDLYKGIDFALEEFLLLFASEDQKEGMHAFIEKRKPEWKGR